MNDQSPQNVSIYEPPTTALSHRVDDEWMEQLWRMATAVVKAGMVPPGMKNAETIWLAMMHGAEIGLRPMQAIQSIAVINNRPSLFGDGALGVVRRSNMMEEFKEWFEGDGDTLVAWCRVKRRGEEAIERTFSVQDAKVSKLWGKKGREGQDTPWTTYPKRMLQMRARAFALRDGFADVFKGLHLAEEVMDLEPVTQPGPRTSGVAERLKSPAPEQSPTHADAITREMAQEMTGVTPEMLGVAKDAPEGSEATQEPPEKKNAPTATPSGKEGASEEPEVTFVQTDEEREWLYDLHEALVGVTNQLELDAVVKEYASNHGELSDATQAEAQAKVDTKRKKLVVTKRAR